jgi:1-phosphatidylinositol-4-phosphate 5-kinase
MTDPHGFAVATDTAAITAAVAVPAAATAEKANTLQLNVDSATNTTTCRKPHRDGKDDENDDKHVDFIVASVDSPTMDLSHIPNHAARVAHGRTATAGACIHHGGHSDQFSHTNSEGGQSYQIMEYDLADNEHGFGRHVYDYSDKADEHSGTDEDDDFVNNPMLLAATEPQIEDNTPAAAALRANANVKVSTVGKAARAVHMQSVRKLIKRATGTTHSGFVRGKPPRLPPDVQEEEQSQGEEVSLEAHEQHNRRAIHGSSAPHPPFHHPQPLQPHPHAHSLAHPPLPTQAPQAIPPTSLESTVVLGVRVQPHDVDSADVMPDAVVKGTVEAGKKVLVSVDPHDMLKFLRWRRKKKAHGQQPPVAKSYVKGKVIDGEHELYTLSIAVMIGVRTSISSTNAVINGTTAQQNQPFPDATASQPSKRWVQSTDFSASEKYEFRPKGGATPPHRLAHTFKFKDYSPIVFAYLRRMYGVNEFDFLLSVCGNANFIEFISNAKSGQFFFYSSDGKYMIKTMTNAESKFLRRILPSYFRHCCENPNTLITRFFGMYRVKLYHLRRNVKFVIMNSVYYTDKYLQNFYDLKGSVVGRNAKPGQAVKKDNDLRQGLPESALSLRPPVRTHMRDQISADCEFLRQMEIMDYSMLVGVHHVPPVEDHSLATIGFRASARTSAQRMRKGSLEMDSGWKPLPQDPVTNGALVDGSGSEEKITDFSVVSDRRYNRNESLGGFFLDDGLEDDESSYLMGSSRRFEPRSPSFHEETERKRQATIEKLYWPFHRLFDIHGYRLLEPVQCTKCFAAPCNCDSDASLLEGYKIPIFVKPLSERKDGGLEMDTTGRQLPMKLKGPHGDQLYEGKIFYMGIIDVLQEYTSRKRVESSYRALTSSGKFEASCVPPDVYGERFVRFFDEYTVGMTQSKEGTKGSIEKTKNTPDKL